MIYLLDTNTLSLFMRGKDALLRDKVLENLEDWQSES